jgi:glycosyltransferase involved in cell wall biosynthesis
MERPIADVSVVVANYNNGKYLSKFFESFIDSSFFPRELIFVDDGSLDDSVAQVELLAREYSFIKLLKLPVNRGFANALNEGLKLSTSKYVMRVDPDDYISCNRIEEQYNYLEKHADIDIVGSNIVYFDSLSGKPVFKSNVPLNHKNILKYFENGNCGIIHGSMLCKASVIKKYNYNQESIPAEDYEIFSLMLKNGSVAVNLPDTYTFVRIHMNSVSNNLPFSTIKRTFQLGEKIWNLKTNSFNVRRIHLHLYSYRQFLFRRGLDKYFYLFASVVFNPQKFIYRISAKQ